MKKIIILIFTLFYLNVIAQSCPTTSEYQSNSLASPLACDYNELNTNQYCIDIKFHIIRNTDGTNGFDSNQLLNVLNELNFYFNPRGIYFKSKGFDYTNNTALNNFATYNATFAINNDPNAVNFYFAKTPVFNPNNPSTFGSSYAGGFGNRNLVVNINEVFNNQGKTTSHEMGHCLGLYHVFEKTNANGTTGQGITCFENVDGTNCLTCGDKVCDTPSNACNGSNGCSIDSSNIMYGNYIGGNKDHFTAGQGTRMRNMIKCNFLNLQSYQCAKLTGLAYTCLDEVKIYTVEVFPNTSPTISWSVSPNLQIIGSNITSSVSIKTVANTENNVYGILTLTINGTVITKQIWIGAPITNSYSISGAYDWVSTNNGAMGLMVSSNSTITSYLWTIEIDDFTPTCPNSNSPARFPITSLQTPIDNYHLETNTPYATVNWGNCIGNYVLTCYAKNECGENAYLVKYVNVGDPKNNPCFKNAFNLNVAPNPIIDGRIQILVNKSIRQSPCNYKVDYENSGFHFDLGVVENNIFIYNYNGILVYNRKYDSDEFVIDDANLERGNYIINIFTREGGMDQSIIVVD